MHSPTTSPGVALRRDLMVFKIRGPAWCSSSITMHRRRWQSSETTLWKAPTAFLGASSMPMAFSSSSMKLNGLSPATGESSTKRIRAPYFAIRLFAALVFPLPVSPWTRMNRPLPPSPAHSMKARRSWTTAARSSYSSSPTSSPLPVASMSAHTERYLTSCRSTSISPNSPRRIFP